MPRREGDSVVIKANALQCRFCNELARKNKGYQRPCSYKSCDSSDTQQADINLYLSLWNMLQTAESVPKERILELAGANNPTSIQVLIEMDAEWAKIQQRAKELGRG